MEKELLGERAKIIRRVRAFFDGREYLEVDTPLLAPALIPESCLEVFKTNRIQPKGSQRPEKPYWLIPSPEIWMKLLIARHKCSLYQICKCFRNGESSGFQHSPEFTMLEYYTINADYFDSLVLTEELFGFLLKAGLNWGKTLGNLSPPFIRITVEEAFARWAGFDLFKAAGQSGAIEEEAKRLGLSPPPGLSIGELYDLIFIHAVEPNLKMNKPVALTDYPAFVPCLAKESPGGGTVERWELYARGIELANCFTEETREEKVNAFFKAENAKKEKSALVRHAASGAFLEMYEGNKFPPCSGVAMGLDRLIMVFLGRSTIDGVLPFPME
jgi:lysyl-tRNA synthetase class 2